MALKVEWYLQFNKFPSQNDKRYAYQLKEFDFYDAYAPLDTMSAENRAKATAVDMMLLQSNDIVRSRVMRDRHALADVLCDAFRKTIMETLAQHDTIDGYQNHDQ